MKRYIFKIKKKLLHVDADNILSAKQIARELYGEQVKFYAIGKIYGAKQQYYGSKNQ